MKRFAIVAVPLLLSIMAIGIGVAFLRIRPSGLVPGRARPAATAEPLAEPAEPAEEQAR